MKNLRRTTETIRKGNKNMSEDHLRNILPSAFHNCSRNIQKILLKSTKVVMILSHYPKLLL